MFLQDRFARVYLGYSTRENFLASLGPVVLNSSSPPVSARRRKERRTFPTNRGERDLRDREGDGGKNSAQTGEKEIFGEIRRSTRETRKTRERTVGSGKNESTKNVTSVRFRSVMVKSGGRRGVQRALDCGPTSVGFGVDAIEKQGHC